MTPAEQAALRELAELAEGLTHEEIAERLSLSRQRVQQLERTALEKLRRAAGVEPNVEKINAALARATASRRL